MRDGTTSTSSEPALNRRSFICGAVWSVPVIATTVATPLAAASEAPGALLQLTSGCVLYDATSAYGIGFELWNIGDEPYKGLINLRQYLRLGHEVPWPIADQVQYRIQLSRNSFSIGPITTRFNWNIPSWSRNRQAFQDLIITQPLQPGSRAAWGLLASTFNGINGDAMPNWLESLEHTGVVTNASPPAAGVELLTQVPSDWINVDGRCRAMMDGTP